MTSWADVAGKFIDFLKNPSGFGLAALALIAMLVVYMVPMGVMAYLWKDSTSQIVSAVLELRQDLKGYINNQMTANRGKHHLPE